MDNHDMTNDKQHLNMLVAKEIGHTAYFNGQDIVYPVKTKNGGYEAIFDVFADTDQGVKNRDDSLSILTRFGVVVLPEQKGGYVVSVKGSVIGDAWKDYPEAVGAALAYCIGRT